MGFSGDPVVKKPPYNAGNTGSIPDLGRLHMTVEQLPQRALEPVLYNKRSHRSEKLTYHLEN